MATKLGSNQIKEIDADNSPPCPAVDNGNVIVKGFMTDGDRQ